MRHGSGCIGHMVIVLLPDWKFLFLGILPCNKSQNCALGILSNIHLMLAVPVRMPAAELQENPALLQQGTFAL